MSILFSVSGWDVTPWVARLRALDPDRVVHASPDGADLAAVRYALVWKPEPGLLARLPKLEVIFNLGAGVDAILRDQTIPPRIPIVRVVDDSMSMRMTEWVVLQVLAHHRRALHYRRQQRDHVWQDIVGQAAARDVSVGLLGLGALGADAARVLLALRFKVAGWSRQPKSLPNVETYHGADGLDRLLERSDILVCLLPLTAATGGLLSMPSFRKLKRDGPLGGPILINAGRGGEQVEADILAALDDGTLAGASLDVFETEPLASSSRLWDHPRVIVTPHNAADSEPDALTRAIVGQIRRYEAGGPLANVVDRGRGY